MNAATWLKPLPYRACEICVSSCSVAGQRRCRCPSITARADGVDVEVMRAPTGLCGPDARYLDFPGLHVQKPMRVQHAAH
jgi:hypothetical protein